MNTHQDYLVECPLALLYHSKIQLVRLLHVVSQHPASLGYSPVHFHGQKSAPLD